MSAPCSVSATPPAPNARTDAEAISNVEGFMGGFPSVRLGWDGCGSRQEPEEGDAALDRPAGPERADAIGRGELERPGPAPADELEPALDGEDQGDEGELADLDAQ